MGAIDIGVTGSDLIHEAAENGENNVVFVKPLDFGQADVVVAVPDAWIDVQRHGRPRRRRAPTSAAATAAGCASPPNTST